jgi:hypothetical protein
MLAVFTGIFGAESLSCKVTISLTILVAEIEEFQVRTTCRVRATAVQSVSVPIIGILSRGATFNVRYFRKAVNGEAQDNRRYDCVCPVCWWLFDFPANAACSWLTLGLFLLLHPEL